MTLVNTKTNVAQVGTDISIYTYYQKCLNALLMFLTGTPKVVEGLSFKEGELGYTKSGVKDEFYLNSRGELIVTSDDVDKYAIDSSGNLTTTKDFCGNLIEELPS